MTTTHTPIIAPPIRAVIEAGRALERHIERHAPVQLATLLVLDEIAQHPGVTLGPLAVSLDLTRQTVHGVLGRMDAAGLVEKRPDENDPRMPRYYLSVAGVEMLEDCQRRLEGPSAKLCAIIAEACGGVDLAEMLGRFTP